MTTGVRRWPGAMLVGIILLPVLVLFAWTVRLAVLPTPEVFRLSSGDSLLGLCLPADSHAVWKQHQVLVGDGSVRRLEAFRSASAVPEAWLLWRDDAAMTLGRLAGVVVASGDTLRGEAARNALLEMPERISDDEHRLVQELRQSSNTTDSAGAALRLHLFGVHQSRVLALMDAEGVGRIEVPLVRIRHAERFDDGFWASAGRVSSRLAFQIRASPDLGSGGGLWSALVATTLVVFLAGLLGGIPALFLAVHLADQLDPGPGARWLRRAAEALSGVPGVVWGTVCAALLASAWAWDFGGMRVSSAPLGGVFWAGLTLGILSAPVTFSRAMHAVDRVPRTSREIARSCGASRYQVLFMVVLPACRRELFGAWLSGLARASGETAPLLLVGAAGGLGASWHLGTSLPALTGEFLHLGAMACSPPWPTVEAQMGHPLAFLALSLVAVGCMALEWAALHAEKDHK